MISGKDSMCSLHANCVHTDIISFDPYKCPAHGGHTARSCWMDKVGTVIPTSQMRKLRPREVKWLPQGLAACDSRSCWVQGRLEAGRIMKGSVFMLGFFSCWEDLWFGGLVFPVGSEDCFLSASPPWWKFRNLIRFYSVLFSSPCIF